MMHLVKSNNSTYNKPSRVTLKLRPRPSVRISANTLQNLCHCLSYSQIETRTVWTVTPSLYWFFKLQHIWLGKSGTKLNNKSDYETSISRTVLVSIFLPLYSVLTSGKIVYCLFDNKSIWWFKRHGWCMNWLTRPQLFVLIAEDMMPQWMGHVNWANKAKRWNGLAVGWIKLISWGGSSSPPLCIWIWEI